MNDTRQQNTSETAPITKYSEKRTLFGVVLLYLIIILVVFAQCLPYPLLDWDDHLHLTDNSNLNPISLEGIRNIWTKPYEGLYIPVSYTFFALETFLTRLLFGSQEGLELPPYLFHAGSLLLHLVNSVLIYRILKIVVNDSRAACLGGVLFLIHPLQVESVVWISETRGLLSNFFSITAIFYTLKSIKQSRISETDLSSATPTQSRNRIYELIIATVCILLSMLAKPSSVTTPLIIAILVYGFFPQQLKTLRIWIFSWLVLALVLVIVNRGEQSDLLFESPYWARPLIAGDSLAFYLWKLLIPYPLIMQYDKSMKLILDSAWIYWSWILPCLIFLLACFTKQRRIWLTILAVFTVGLLPMLGVVPFAYQFISTVADRYIYLSMLGPALAVAWLLRNTHQLIAIGSTCFIMTVFACLSFLQITAWSGSNVLYQHCLTYNPRAFIALNNLGHMAFKNQNYEKALHYFNKSIEVMPDDIGTNQNLGATYMKLGDMDLALKYYQRALEVDPKHPGTHLALGIFYDSQADNKKAFEHYLQALQAEPQNVDALNRLGSLARKQKKLKDALRYYKLALKFRPNDHHIRENLGNLYLEMGDEKNAQAQFELSRSEGRVDPANEFNLGLIAAKNNDLQKAIQHYQSALQNINQQNSPDLYQKIIQELALTYNLLGTILQQQQRHQEAVKYFQLTTKTNPDLAPAYFNLAESLHQLKQTQAAITALQKALALVPANSEPAQDIQKRIDLYQKK